MAKIVVHNETDPQIAIILEEVGPGVPGKALGTHGTCTECGWSMHRWDFTRAVEGAKAHVDGHEAVLIGGDRESLVRGGWNDSVSSIRSIRF